MSNLKTTIGLEIHVQLKTKSKMFCRCDNDAEGKVPNTTICPVCLGMPGVLPVANEQAIIWTIKTGLVLNCEINKIAKFDRKHYFYPDLPKGYQISQFDEPFCVGGYLDVEGHKIRLNRIHLEEDAGKLIHCDGESLVDLNRAGTPLMEIVTEPDIESAVEAGKFLRTLQKIVRDVAAVSEASMEKGHLRCDANISVSDENGKMSEIVEIKNLNSFKFVEKALLIEEGKLKDKYPDWPENIRKETHGYDSKKNITYIQRVKEEAADYRYFPEPDLPPIDSSIFDLAKLKEELNDSEEMIVNKLVSNGIAEPEAKSLAANKAKLNLFYEISKSFDDNSLIAKSIVHNYFNREIDQKDMSFAKEYAEALADLKKEKISKAMFSKISESVYRDNIKYADSLAKNGGEQMQDDNELERVIGLILSENSAEVDRYNSGQKQLIGFFVGEVMKKTAGKANPGAASALLKKLLDN